MVNKNQPSFLTLYGDGLDGTCPTAEQWEWVQSQPDDKPLTLVNFFKFRNIADYAHIPQKQESSISGEEAFFRYASVSGPALERAGGHFLHVGPYSHSFIGQEEDWDMVAIGQYPNKAALIALFADPKYLAAYSHRTAACLRQKTLIS